MNAKTVFSTALVWTALGLGAVRGQSPYASGGPSSGPPSMPGPSGSPYTGPVENPPGPTAASKYSVSSWIRGDKYCCCDEVGGNGPIQTDLFFRAGPSVIIGLDG